MRCRKISLALLAAALLSAMLTAADPQPSSCDGSSKGGVKKEFRTLHFPPKVAVGIVYQRRRALKTPTLSFFEGWKKVGEARGAVRIPADADARLDVSKTASADLSCLSKLQPDDVQYLDLANSDIDNNSLRHVGRLTGLRILNLNYTKITDAGIEHLSRLKKLRVIWLSAFGVHEKGFGVGDKAMKVLATLPRLEWIDLRLSKVGDVGLAELAKLKSLRYLGLAGTKITDAGLVHLKRLPHLRFLTLDGRGEKSKITDEGLKIVGGLRELWRLDLNATKVTDKGLVHLRGLTRLKWLCIDDTKVTEAGLKHLKPLTSLEHLRLYINITDEGAGHLAKVPSLRHLNCHLQVSNQGLAELAKLPHLESLDLAWESTVTDAGLRHLAGKKSLKWLHIQGPPITDAGLARLTGLDNLEYLTLSGTHIAGDGLKHLKNLAKLRILHFDLRRRDFNSERDGLRHLRELSQVKDLRLAGPGLTNSDLAHLSGLVQLEDLSISDLHLDDTGAFHLAGLVSLKRLELSDGVLTDVGLRHLGNLADLEYLNLHGHFSDEGLNHLKKLKSLQSVYLSSPYLTEAGTRKFHQAHPLLLNLRRYPYSPGTPEISYRRFDTFRRNGTEKQRKEQNALERKPPPAWHLAGWINADKSGLTPKGLRGKVVLIDFWGTWCGPCLASMPELKRLHKKYGPRGFAIVGIHTTYGAKTMADFAKEKQLPWPVATDVETKTVRAWKVESYPSLYLIDRAGKLRVATIYRGDLERAIVTLLREKRDRKTP